MGRKLLLTLGVFLIVFGVFVGKPQKVSAGGCGCVGIGTLGVGVGITVCNDFIFEVPSNIPQNSCVMVGPTSNCSCMPKSECGGHLQPPCKAVPNWLIAAVQVARGPVLDYILSLDENFDFDAEVANANNKCRAPDEKYPTSKGFICATSQEEADGAEITLVEQAAFNLCEMAGSPAGCSDCASSGGVWTAIGCVKTTRQEIVSVLLTIAISVSGGTLLLRVLFASFLLSSSQGDQNKTQNAREIFTSSFAGMLFLFFSIVLLNTIGVNILHIPGF